MTDLSIPLPVLYAGLGGTLLALIVATAQNQWSCRVFFLLALRLAIGWHFLFEGMHKIHSHLVGPSETNRVFTSEPYFKVAPGPVGGFMRKQFDDPEAIIAAKVKPAKDYTPEAFAKLSAEEQAAACPTKVGEEFDRVADLNSAESDRVLKAISAAEAKGVSAVGSEADKEAVRKHAKTAQDEFKQVTDEAAKIQARPVMTPTEAKAAYARWVYGVDRRPAKVKFVTGDTTLTAPEQLAHIDRLRHELSAADSRSTVGLGNGNGIDVKRVAELRSDLLAAVGGLAKDANDFADDLKLGLGVISTPTFLTGLERKLGLEPESTMFMSDLKDQLKAKTEGQRTDKVTMWFLVVVGGCLMAGLLTRVMCVLGAGFLAVTYLAHPPFPWYPLPPNTEGNPLFINKNVIEGLALLALACMPTGRWLGLDALLMRACGCGRSESTATA